MSWMDGNWEVERNREMLKRIVALLVALAGLAERAAGAPYPVRLIVLGILCRAEACARMFVIGMAHDLGAPAAPRSHAVPARPAAQDADAARLALSFRELALVLDYMLVQARRFCRDANRVAAATLNLRYNAHDGTARVASRAAAKNLRARTGSHDAGLPSCAPYPDTS